jgi:hypothetical protein
VVNDQPATSLPEYLASAAYQRFLADGAPGRFDVFADHIVVQLGGCNCASPGAEFGHEAHCGYEPVMTLDEFRALPAEALGALLRRAGHPHASDDRDRRG